MTEIDAAGVATLETPLNFEYPKDQFFDFVSAQILSTSTKKIADPTLMVLEGESSSVGVGTTYAVNCETVTTDFSTSTNIVKEEAGLQVTVSVKRIDDNGFVTLKLDPTIKAPTAPQFLACGDGLVTIYDLVVRQLKTGEFRVRDGQTLILTGVIQDETKEVVTKWPVVGDLPLIGQFFRKTNSIREKRELVILVTPAIVNDDQGGDYGYGYEPSTQAAKKLIYQP